MNRATASAVAACLLTGSNELRKRFDHHVGLNSKSCERETFVAIKEKSEQLLDELRAIPEFTETLVKVKLLPPPHYNSEQWEVLQSLFTLLPILAAHLMLVFREANVCDFTAVAEQASQALGEESQPTDLTLYLDNAIHHLLVDEFQDTSIQQSRLLEKLVAGWQPGDGRTLFVVGDPMQSIYRFRQAEVGLFLKAKHQGIGSVHLTPLELRCNFRSTPAIVNWVNEQFQFIFPAQDDVESGAISFYPSSAVNQESEASEIMAYEFGNRKQEAENLIKLLQEQLNQYPEDEIAILVRSRGHLDEIVTLLREQNIPFQGVDIEQLSQLAHIRDVWSLTRALLFPADRLSWLCVLRSPWCGLLLSDIHILATFERKKSILQALANLEHLTGLSEEGLIRARYFYQVMSEAIARRQQSSLVEWVKQTLEKLHYKQVIDKDQNEDLAQFWLLLEQHSPQGQIDDLPRFEEILAKLYSQNIKPSHLQIMTIHKSKGLEFDSVILPGLGNKPNNRDNPILRWMKLPSERDKDQVLISPIRAAHEKESLLYDFIADVDTEKERYELQRLFYVAATRAKKRLYLFDNQAKGYKNTFRSLLGGYAFISQKNQEKEEETEARLPVLKRLPLDYYRNPPPSVLEEDNLITPAKSITNARQIGIITHALLQWICNNHPDQLEKLPWKMVSRQLKLAGLDASQQQETLSLIQQQIQRLFSEDIGRWICQAHDREHNEYELLVLENGQANTRIIDRTFFEKEKRWIIDFKTGNEDSNSLKQHQNQVNGYARLLADQSTGAVSCGLYYLATGHWVSWEFTGGIVPSSPPSPSRERGF